MDTLNNGILRDEFPHSRTQIYLNHCAISPIPTRSLEAANEHLKQRNSGAVDTFELDEPVIESARNHAANLINSESIETIAFIPNTSHGINLIAAGISWEVGDEIILSDIEFPTNVYPYLLSEEHKTNVIRIDGSDGKVPVDRVEEAITPRTRVVALSAVQFLSGFRADLKAIGQLCRENNIYFVVDAIQALGQVPVDVRDMNIDALVAGGHKWLLGTQGQGLIYVSERMQQELKPVFPGWLSVENPWDLLNYDQSLQTTARQYEGGMYNGPGIRVLEKSLELLNEVGVEKINKHITELQNYFEEQIRHIPVRRYGSAESIHRSGILAYTIPESTDSEKLMATFRENDIKVSVREGILRIAPHLYNNADEMDRTADVLKQAVT